jgi:hypothetical protein
MNADELAVQVGLAAREELRDAIGKIRHCLDQLSEEQVWQRPQPGLNSIGNLLLHLAGNLTQWVVCGVGGERDHRNRAAEFAAEGEFSKVEMLQKVGDAAIAAQSVLEQLTCSELLRVRRIQGFEVTGLAAIFHSVPHFRGHTQEIVHIARTLLGDRYQVQWQPRTAEEGAPE